MPKNTRLDESFSRTLVIKTITGQPDVQIDISTLSIGPSGNLQPAQGPSVDHHNPSTPSLPFKSDRGV